MKFSRILNVLWGKGKAMAAEELQPDRPHAGGARKLVKMANQIGAFFASQGPEVAVAETLNHLKKFWEPRMRVAIVAHLKEGGEGMRPEVRLAVEELSREAVAPGRE